MKTNSNLLLPTKLEDNPLAPIRQKKRQQPGRQPRAHSSYMNRRQNNSNLGKNQRNPLQMNVQQRQYNNQQFNNQQQNLYRAPKSYQNNQIRTGQYPLIQNNNVNIKNQYQKQRIGKQDISKSQTYNDFYRSGKHNDDNVSMKSRNSRISNVSTKSIKKKYLRGVSINNQEHLFSLYQKEKKLQNFNYNQINSFLNQMNGQSQKIQNTLQQSYTKKLQLIWGDYFKDQKRKNNFSVQQEQQIYQGVDQINQKFQKSLQVKSLSFMENLKLKIYESIFKQLEMSQTRKHYLNEDVEFLVENQLNPLLEQKQQTSQVLEEKRNNFLLLIKDEEDRYQLAQQNHLEAYENELGFKLSSEQNLVKQLLKNGHQFLSDKTDKLNVDLRNIESSYKDSRVQQLQQEIEQLQNKIITNSQLVLVNQLTKEKIINLNIFKCNPLRLIFYHICVIRQTIFYSITMYTQQKLLIQIITCKKITFNYCKYNYFQYIQLQFQQRILFNRFSKKKHQVKIRYKSFWT